MDNLSFETAITDKIRNIGSNLDVKYLGISCIAKLYWCHYYSIFKSIIEEDMFENTYKSLIKNVDLINPTIDKYNNLIKDQIYENNEKNEFIFIDCDKGIENIGYIGEELFGEKYPTTQFYFKYKNKIIIGVPDGITDKFCYEFKTTTLGSEYTEFFLLPVAICQANLYSFFLKRPNIRVQIYLVNEDRMITIKEKTNIRKAQDDLEKIIELLDGISLPIAGKKLKCKKCVYNKYCKELHYGAYQICKDADCSKLAKYKGFCRNHYENYRKNLTPNDKDFMKCSVDECINNAMVKGFCLSHYNNYKKSLKPSDLGYKKCSIEECIENATTKGFCSKHYKKFLKQKKKEMYSN